jgi:hypothetical protein
MDGKDIKASGMSAIQFSGDKIKEVWSNWDSLGLAKQTGRVKEEGANLIITEEEAIGGPAPLQDT